MYYISHVFFHKHSSLLETLFFFFENSLFRSFSLIIFFSLPFYTFYSHYSDMGHVNVYVNILMYLHVNILFLISILLDKKKRGGRGGGEDHKSLINEMYHLQHICTLFDYNPYRLCSCSISIVFDLTLNPIS